MTFTRILRSWSAPSHYGPEFVARLDKPAFPFQIKANRGQENKVACARSVQEVWDMVQHMEREGWKCEVEKL